MQSPIIKDYTRDLRRGQSKGIIKSIDHKRKLCETREDTHTLKHLKEAPFISSDDLKDEITHGSSVKVLPNRDSY